MIYRIERIDKEEKQLMDFYKDQKDFSVKEFQDIIECMKEMQIVQYSEETEITLDKLKELL